MTSRKELVTLYRGSEDFHRYSAENREALQRMRRVLRNDGRSFGRSLLDLGCGGGALARLYERRGRSYVGIDTNPDMIREARRSAQTRGSSASFLLSDVRRVRLVGRFDTVVMLGNALSHLTTQDFLQVLRRLSGHLRPSARFIVDYRDTVRLFFDGKWGKRHVQHKGGHRLVSTTRGVNLQRGEILIVSRRDGVRGSIAGSQTVWSPFVLEPLMVSQGWRLVRRTPERRWYGWRDVYRYESD
jgi:SAM-dependent methyltransferase